MPAAVNVNTVFRLVSTPTGGRFHWYVHTRISTASSVTLSCIRADTVGIPTVVVDALFEFVVVLEVVDVVVVVEVLVVVVLVIVVIVLVVVDVEVLVVVVVVLVVVVVDVEVLVVVVVVVVVAILVVEVMVVVVVVVVEVMVAVDVVDAVVVVVVDVVLVVVVVVVAVVVVVLVDAAIVLVGVVDVVLHRGRFIVIRISGVASARSNTTKSSIARHVPWLSSSNPPPMYCRSNTPFTLVEANGTPSRYPVTLEPTITTAKCAHLENQLLPSKVRSPGMW